MIKSWKILQQPHSDINFWEDQQLSKDLPKFKKTLSPLRKSWIRKHFKLSIHPRSNHIIRLFNFYVTLADPQLLSPKHIKLYNKSSNWLQSQTTLFTQSYNISDAFKLLNILRLAVQINFLFLPSLVRSFHGSRSVAFVIKSLSYPKPKFTTSSNYTSLNLLRLKNL